MRNLRPLGRIVNAAQETITKQNRELDLLRPLTKEYETAKGLIEAQTLELRGQSQLGHDLYNPRKRNVELAAQLEDAQRDNDHLTTRIMQLVESLANQSDRAYSHKSPASSEGGLWPPSPPNSVTASHHPFLPEHAGETAACVTALDHRITRD